LKQADRRTQNAPFRRFSLAHAASQLVALRW
jgi:hypothetical protein